MPYVGLSEVQKGRIITLTEQGMSQRQIARTVGVTQGVLSKTYARFLELGTLKNRPRRSRGTVTTESQDRFLVQTARRNPTVSHPEHQRQLLQATGVSVSSNLSEKDFVLENYLAEKC